MGGEGGGGRHQAFHNLIVESLNRAARDEESNNKKSYAENDIGRGEWGVGTVRLPVKLNFWCLIRPKVTLSCVVGWKLMSNNKLSNSKFTNWVYISPHACIIFFARGKHLCSYVFAPSFPPEFNQPTLGYSCRLPSEENSRCTWWTQHNKVTHICFQVEAQASAVQKKWFCMRVLITPPSADQDHVPQPLF